MKKIVTLLVILLSTLEGVNSKNFDKEQLALRLEIVKYLSDEGFQPKIDADGDITFNRNDVPYYIIINNKWKEPFLVSLYLEYTYDSEDYTRKNMLNFITPVSQHKVVKLYCMENSYSYRSDVFCQNINVFKSAFYPMLKEIDSARKDIAIFIAAGLDGIDIINDKDAVYNKALDFYEDKDYDLSFKLFQFLADQKYEKAYINMGLAYDFGEGVSKDPITMQKYYNKAIQSGYYSCAYLLGNYYYSNKNYEEAINNFVKCGANENFFKSDALYSLGKMYENGEGIDKSVTQAILCYKKSVECSFQIDCDARLALMRMGETIENENEFLDATKSMLMGLTDKEMYNKGEEYEYGLNEHYVSLTKAYAYYKASADKGYIKAISKMGEIYINKFYPFNDKAKSDKYFSKAIKEYKKRVSSDGEACYELGYMYHNGYGVEKDIEQAKYYYKSGALLEDINASYSIGLIYIDEMEYAEAYKFMLKSAEGGHGIAMYELGKLYENGLGVSYNKEKAIDWYNKCIECNSKASNNAREALKRLSVNEEKE